MSVTEIQMTNHLVECPTKSILYYSFCNKLMSILKVDDK